MNLPRAVSVVRTGLDDAPAFDVVALDYEARMLRRRRLVTEGEREILVDLPETVSLNHGDRLRLENGAVVEVRAAPEALLEVTGDLPRLAWHIGNRHTPCQIFAHRLLIQQDHVLQAMLEGLGAKVRAVEEPFTPEGGAYGHGRTMGHSHGHSHG